MARVHRTAPMKRRRNRARLGRVQNSGKVYHVTADGETIYIRPRYGRTEFTVPINSVVTTAISRNETPADRRPASPQN